MNIFKLTESEKNRIRLMYEQNKEKEERRFCNTGNVKSLSEILGDDETEEYIPGVTINKNGVRRMSQVLDLLRAIDMFDGVNDGGEHLCYDLMNQIKSFFPYHYYDETRDECLTAIQKIVELYKENKHGTELVKDLEFVYNLNEVNQRAKEYIKRCLEMIKEKK